jgi:hypothetical protein
MSEHVAPSLRLWRAVLCGIAIAVAMVMAGPHLLAESTHAARPFGGVALRSLVWIVIAFAAYWALARAPQGHALASGRAPSRDDR